MLTTNETRAGPEHCAAGPSPCCRKPARSASGKSTGWMQDQADPHARDLELDIARRDPTAPTNRIRIDIS